MSKTGRIYPNKVWANPDTAKARIDELEARDALVAKLVDAVNALPVEEWVVEHTRYNAYGEPVLEPELIGYVMQAQGEWDAVKAALKALQEKADA